MSVSEGDYTICIDFGGSDNGYFYTATCGMLGAYTTTAMVAMCVLTARIVNVR